MTARPPRRAALLALLALAGCGAGESPPPRTPAFEPDRLTANGRQVQFVGGCLPVRDGTRVACIDQEPQPVAARLTASPLGRIALRLGAAAPEARARLERRGAPIGPIQRIGGDRAALARAFLLSPRARDGDVLVLFVRFQRGGGARFATVLRVP